MSGAYYINPSPATADACYRELSRLGTLRENGIVPDAEYYATDAKLTRRLLELQAADPGRLMTDAEVAILVRLPEAPAGCVKAIEPVKELQPEDYEYAAEIAAAFKDGMSHDTEADIELRFGGLLQDPDASAETVNAAMREWRGIKGYAYEEVG